MTLHWSVILHVGFGVVALLAGLGAMVTAKGGRIHRRCGRVFFWSMVVVALGAVQLSYEIHSLFLFLDTIFTFYLALSGYRALSRKDPLRGQRANWLDWSAATILLAGGLGLIGVALFSDAERLLATGGGTPRVSFGYGTCGVLFAVHDLHEFARPPAGKYHWWLSHMARMLGAYLAAVTAVSIVNLPTESIPVRWFGPILVGAPGIVIWMRYYRKRFRRERERAYLPQMVRENQSRSST